MTLEELIATLTTAQEQATKGKWEWDEAEEDGKPWFSIDKIWVVGPQDAEGFLPEDLEAIAVRHNTASDVLRVLNQLDESMTLARVCSESAKAIVTRAEKAEADRDDWKESASYWRTLAKAQIQQLENKQ